ncbi:MAG: VWA domain-containing protein [Candidatus Aminicenantes bacterium]|nr:VWA domain-containing protein [Candidatus Aminicenantes bacterium]
MKTCRGFCVAFAVFSLMIASAATHSAQEAAQKPIKVEVNVTTKLIQVAVTDRKGNPILDLTPADFEVRDAGKVVKIDYLEKHNYGGGTQDVSVSVPDARPVARKFFFVFDFAYMNANGLKKAKEAALNFVDTALQPGDEVGLVTCSAQRSLSIVEYLTTDHKKVRDLIDAFGLRKLTGRAENLMDYYIVQMNMDLAENADRTKDATIAADPFFEQLVKSRVSLTSDQKSGAVTQVINFTAALKNLARTLRQIPGNKNILYFSNGVPRNILYGRKVQNVAIQETFGDADSMAAYLRQNEDNMDEPAARDAYTEMLEEFEAANCPVFSFNTAPTYSEASVAVDDETAYTMRDAKGDDSLRQFSSTTGGKYYHNTMNLQDAVTDMKNVTGAYYILGYTTNDTADGEYHKIKVKVNRRGVSVQSQPGYYNPKPFKELSEFEKLLQILDVVLAEDPQSAVVDTFDFVPVPVRGDGINLFSGYAALPAESLGPYLSKKTEAVIYLTNAAGNSVAMKRFYLGDLPSGREGLFLHLAFPIKEPGLYNGRLILRNMETGRTALGQTRFEIGQVSGPWTDPLLLLEEGRNLYGTSPTPELSLGAFYNYDPQKYFPRTGAVPLGTAKIQAAVRCGNTGDKDDVKFTAWVQHTGSDPRTELAATVLEQVMMGPTRVARLEIALGDLPAGEYSLYVTAGIPGGPTTPPAVSSLIIR